MAERALRVSVAVLAVLAVGAGTAVVVEHNRPPAAAPTGVATGTATITRTSLATTFQANGTLGYANSYTVAN
jgi:hypothetical protein